MNEYNSRHIKKTPSGSYQIQVYRNKKSYSDYATNFSEALAKRRILYKKLGITEKNQLPHYWGVSNRKNKKSLLPDGSAMAVGICMSSSITRGGDKREHSIQVSYKKDLSDKTYSIKYFYLGTTELDDKPSNGTTWNKYGEALLFRTNFEKKVLATGREVG